MTQNEFERDVNEFFRAIRERRAAYCRRRERSCWWWVGFNVVMAAFDGLCVAFIDYSVPAVAMMSFFCVAQVFFAVSTARTALFWRNERAAAGDGSAGESSDGRSDSPRAESP